MLIKEGLISIIYKINKKKLYRFVFLVGFIIIASSPNSRSVELSIQETIDLALRHNFDLKKKKILVEIGDHELKVKKAKYIPSFEANIYRSKSDKEIDEMSITDAYKGVSLVQNLPFGGQVKVGLTDNHTKIKDEQVLTEPYKLSGLQFQFRQPLLKGGLAAPLFNDIKTAKCELKIRELAQQDAKIELMQKVKAAYISILRLTEEKKVKEEILRVSESILELLKKRFDQHMIAEMEINLAQIEHDRDAEALIIVQEKVVDANRILQQLLGVRETIVPNGKLNVSSPSLIIKNLIALAKDKNIRLRWLKESLIKQHIIVDQARSDMLPQFDFLIEVNRESEKNTRQDKFHDKDEIKVGITFTQPIYTLAERNNYQIRRAEETVFEVEYRKTLHQIKIAIENSVEKLSLIDHKISLLDDQVANARTRLKFISKAFENGLIDTRSLYDTRDDLLEIEERRILAHEEKRNVLFLVESLVGTSLD